VVWPDSESVLVLVRNPAGTDAVPTSIFFEDGLAVIWKTLLIDDAWGLKLTLAVVVAGSATKRTLAIISKTITINTGMIVSGDNLNPLRGGRGGFPGVGIIEGGSMPCLFCCIAGASKALVGAP